ncbi:conserved Plasmodium protein, unknown function [Plasmodium ovale wallikeri]|uniref:Uncharacterized protein n=1 Tax=Plasmodium ovale wallikeri TaxID=864142 RepID=A0A1A8ZA35_PLAOA|nr:conserved Plasmodium protein, unknown function [Plasmodium ovale wallikeri]SBT41013.1 conserved Plasmodium protein, unknown function [Plasmodium ovale wallikeri]
MGTFKSFAPGDKNKEDEKTLNNTFSSSKMDNEKTVGVNTPFNVSRNATNLFFEKNSTITSEEKKGGNDNTNLPNNSVNANQSNLTIFAKKNEDIFARTDGNNKEVLNITTEKNHSQMNTQNGNISLEKKFNFNSSLKIRKSLTEQLCGRNTFKGASIQKLVLCMEKLSFTHVFFPALPLPPNPLTEEISMKLGKIFLCKSYLETYIFERSPYIMNFVYVKDDMSEPKNRVLNSLMLSSFCNLIWNTNIFKHEYLISKEILNKYIKAIEKNPDKNNFCIVPIYDLEKIKIVLNYQEKNIQQLKKKKLCIKKNNENLLFILNIIKNNFFEIKIKAQKIIQRLLFRLNILDKLFLLKNNAAFFSNKYEFNKFKLMEILELFNSFNIDSQVEKINKNIKEFVKGKKTIQNFLHADNEFASSVKSSIGKNEKVLHCEWPSCYAIMRSFALIYLFRVSPPFFNLYAHPSFFPPPQEITELKRTTSEICINVEENKEYLYHLSAFEREENYQML